MTGIGRALAVKRRLLHGLGALVLAWCLGAVPAVAAPGRGPSDLLLLAEWAPEQARTALAALAMPSTGNGAQRRDHALVQAWATLFADESDAQVAAAMATLDGSTRAWSARLADADAGLLAALRAERRGQPVAAQLARQALETYETYCGAEAALQADCEHRGRWRARQLLAQHALRQQSGDAAQAQAQAARELAIAAGDTRRQAASDTLLALTAIHRGDINNAARHLDRARQAAGRPAEVPLLLRMAQAEASLARLQHQWPRARAALQRALHVARNDGTPRQQASMLIDLSDLEAKAQRPQQALAAAEQGLALLGNQPAPLMRRALLHNAILARVALHRVAEVRRDFDALWAAWGETDVSGQQLLSLRELGDALAASGDHKGALEMHHREQALSLRLDSANREAALAELRTRFDREAEGQRIELLARSNRLASTTLANQALVQRLWATAGGVLLLASALLLLLLRRVRQTGRLLASNQARLKVQSERDALTGASSRRHAQAVLAEAGAQGHLTGALLMVDLDHFKQINDRHGHAAGDEVLATMAQRIMSALRPQDLVARWGGEEFLVYAGDMGRDEADALATRLLHAVSGQPVDLKTAGAQALRVTASIGHAVFPLAPHGLAVGVEQATNLVDMALYSAKGQGRHRAVGIVGCDASTAAALRDVEADFEGAWQAGRLQLRTDLGPGPVLDHAPAGAHWAPIEQNLSETHP